MASSKLSTASSWQGTVLSKDNLEVYTDWLIELRDYVYSHGLLCGELMEHHLIGEPCDTPVIAGGPATTDDDSQQGLIGKSSLDFLGFSLALYMFIVVV